MSQPSRREWATWNLEQVRDQLLDAAAFGKRLTPEHLEHAAGRIGASLRVFQELTRGGPDFGAIAGRGCTGRGQLGPRGESPDR
ncbi:hypothetical protein F5X71_28200 [Nocardia brasiliensis]|uniref:Uncharacterized protein n=1 Tax=Nocardia brasiliensis TaxID=37326 RepID=A0A6G9XXV8_NOCBR|nr:DUF6374 family protein [Nocardia brasiliensis]QIS05673.1 hypothetical protein F5X71_28200 [Nocardia brasiliensis]